MSFTIWDWVSGVLQGLAACGRFTLPASYSPTGACTWWGLSRLGSAFHLCIRLSFQINVHSHRGDRTTAASRQPPLSQPLLRSLVHSNTWAISCTGSTPTCSRP